MIFRGIILYTNFENKINQFYKKELDQKDVERQLLPLFQKLMISIFLITLAGFIMSMIKNELNHISLLETFDLLHDYDLEKNDHCIKQSKELLDSKKLNKDLSNNIISDINSVIQQYLNKKI